MYGALALTLAQAWALSPALTLALALGHITFESFIKIYPLMMVVMMTDYDAWCVDAGAGTGIGTRIGTGIGTCTSIGIGTSTGNGMDTDMIRLDQSR